MQLLHRYLESLIHDVHGASWDGNEPNKQEEVLS